MVTIETQWSAAFISWVVTDTLRNRLTFPARSNHLEYAQAIRTGNYGFTVLNPQTTSPAVGDIVINKRVDRNGTSSTLLTFDTNPWSGPSHGDIVVGIEGNTVYVVGGNLSNKVKQRSTSLSNGKLNNNYFIILRPTNPTLMQEVVNAARREAEVWRRDGLTDLDSRSDPYLTKYWLAVGETFQRNTGTPIIPAAGVIAPLTDGGRGAPDISPFITLNDSLHPHIQYELTRRRNAAETIHSHMPFVKLTSLSKVYNSNLTTGGTDTDFGAYCPTLGIHGDQKPSFENLYTPANNRSIVARATRIVNGIPEFTDVVASADEDPPNIPPPGIVGMTCERSTAGGFGVRGGLFKANLSIKAYSIGQLNVLLRYFLRQGTKVVLEMGRISSSPAEKALMESGELREQGLKDSKSTNVKQMFQKFNWRRPQAEIETELSPYVLLEKGQRDLIDKYTYNNLGNYELFIGYVATFKVNYTKDNTYNIDLTIHSVQQFEVPTRLGGTRSSSTSPVTVPNTCEAIDIMDYFTSAFRRNSFLRVLARCTEGTDPDIVEDTESRELSSKWYPHVIKLRSEGAQVGTNGLKKDGFLISWECFVNLILNDPVYGLLGTFQIESNVDSTTLSTLRSGLISPIGTTRFGGENDVNSNEVSWNENLRSTNLNVLVINNPVAQAKANRNIFLEALPIIEGQRDIEANEANILRQSLTSVEAETVKTTIITNTTVGSFNRTTQSTSYLTQGIWINSNAIINAFSGADTISQGISNLLNEMNSAVQGYWNLQLLSAEPEAKGLHVIDAGLSKPVEKPLIPTTDDRFVAPPLGEQLVNRFRQDIDYFTNDDGTPTYLYSFNRKLKRSGSLSEGPIHLGSELLDIKYEADMPVVIAVQAIAGIGGTAQRAFGETIDVDELRKIAMFDTFVKSETQSNDICTDGPANKLIDPQLYQSSGLTESEAYTIFALSSDPNAITDKSKTLEERIEEITDAAYSRWEEQNEDKEAMEKEAYKTNLKTTAAAIRDIVSQNFETRNPGVLQLVRSYAPSFGKALELLEYDISTFIKRLDETRRNTQNKIHPFNSSNLTKTTIDLTLPGIGGILLFQAFHVERIPNILQRGYYVVTKVGHEFSVENGWVTKITGRFRYKPDVRTITP